MGNISSASTISSICYSKQHNSNENDIMKIPIGFILFLIEKDMIKNYIYEDNYKKIKHEYFQKTNWFHKKHIMELFKAKFDIKDNHLCTYSTRQIVINTNEIDKEIIQNFVFCEYCDEGFLLKDKICQDCFESEGKCDSCLFNLKKCPKCGKNSDIFCPIMIQNFITIIMDVIRQDGIAGHPWVTNWMIDCGILPFMIKDKDIKREVLDQICSNMFAVFSGKMDGCLVYEHDPENSDWNDYNIMVLFDRKNNGGFRMKEFPQFYEVLISSLW